MLGDGAITEEDFGSDDFLQSPEGKILVGNNFAIRGAHRKPNQASVMSDELSFEQDSMFHNFRSQRQANSQYFQSKNGDLFSRAKTMKEDEKVGKHKRQNSTKVINFDDSFGQGIGPVNIKSERLISQGRTLRESVRNSHISEITKEELKRGSGG